MTRLRPTPAHEDQAFALTNALCQRRGRRGHRATSPQIVLKLRAIELDDFSARRRIAMAAENERIAENGVAAIDVDRCLAGAGLSRRAGALGPRRT